MKDLYSFDWTYEQALETYRLVSKAYQQFFKDLRLPIIVAEASSGAMGGKLSHEYHLTSPIGSDTIYTCNTCDYASNDEVATPKLPAFDNQDSLGDEPKEVHVLPRLAWTGVTTDREVLVKVWTPEDAGLPNIHAIKAAEPNIDTTLSGGPAHEAWTGHHETTTAWGPRRIKHLIDGRLAQYMTVVGETFEDWENYRVENVSEDEDGQPLNLVCLEEGDSCPRCSQGKVQTHRALELGHTFYLGTRYSEPFSAKVAAADPKQPKVTLSMGCYGLGISRIFAALVEHFVTDKGLQWPVSIAPFHVYIVPTMDMTDEAWKLYDALATGHEHGKALDVVVDDRKVSFGWKMNDAETIGYPIRVVLGKKFQTDGICEVHVHKLGTRMDMPANEAPAYIAEQIRKLESEEISSVNEQLTENPATGSGKTMAA
jgi:prolyl-tRNA synthetase